MNGKKYLEYARSYQMDAFSQILQKLKLDVDIYHNAKVCGNWRITEHSLGSTCFHIALTGSLFLDVPGHFEGILNTGDLVLFSRELPHRMTPASPQKGSQLHLDHRADQDGTGLLCAAVRFQHQGCRFILDALPPVFIIRHDSSSLWLKSLLDMFMGENLNAGPASKVILDRLAELLFTYALRQYLNEHPDESGILALYGHQRMAKAVEAMHQHPQFKWSLDALAKKSSLSRTIFARTFKEVSGWTAGQYLTWWRMQLAWSLLSSGETMIEVAERVGYHSEASFSRAFQKLFGTSPGKVRRGKQS